MKRQPIQLGDRFRKNDLSGIVFEVVGTSPQAGASSVRLREVGASGDERVYAVEAVCDQRQFVPLNNALQSA